MEYLIAFAVIGGIGLLILFYLISLYNNLVTLRNRFKNAFAQIDVQLKRRYDLIPNLVETAKGFMKHERETLEAVIAARNSAASAGQQAAANPGDPSAMQNLSTAEVALAGSLTKFIGLAEAYPDLKANQNMLLLQEELTSTETKSPLQGKRSMIRLPRITMRARHSQATSWLALGDSKEHLCLRSRFPKSER